MGGGGIQWIEFIYKVKRNGQIIYKGSLSELIDFQIEIYHKGTLRLDATSNCYVEGHHIIFK